jgi:hypothetical protein
MERYCPSDELLYRLPKNEAFLFHKNGFIPLPEVEDEQFLENPLFLMHHHNHAGKVWDRAFELGVIGEKSNLLHIDAHDNLAIREPFPGTEQGVGSFILPRVESGVIRSITWLTHLPYAQPGFDNGQSASFIHYPNSLVSPLLTRRPTVQEISKLTEKEPFDLLDIDLDYFTQGLNQQIPDFILRLQTRKFMRELQEKVEGVKVTTIAISPGYIQRGREGILVEEILRALRK